MQAVRQPHPRTESDLCRPVEGHTGTSANARRRQQCRITPIGSIHPCRHALPTLRRSTSGRLMIYHIAVKYIELNMHDGCHSRCVCADLRGALYALHAPNPISVLSGYSVPGMGIYTYAYCTYAWSILYSWFYWGCHLEIWAISCQAGSGSWRLRGVFIGELAIDQ